MTLMDELHRWIQYAAQIYICYQAITLTDSLSGARSFSDSGDNAISSLMLPVNLFVCFTGKIIHGTVCIVVCMLSVEKKDPLIYSQAKTLYYRGYRCHVLGLKKWLDWGCV